MATVVLMAVLLVGVAAAANPTVKVPGLGSLLGAYVNDSKAVGADMGVAAFLGIPYAKAPVGDLRWRPPQANGPWKESPRDARTWGNTCFQLQIPGMPPVGNMSEDCLFLNVYTPSGALGAKKKLPVMLWIHGGAYTMGASNEYNGEGLVRVSESSLVVVTINYRLNVFGFLGSEALRSRSPDGSVGNYGIQDQRMAIAWVRKHITDFGGDAAQITIFGESAGGSSVINHLTQRASFGLYSKAIVQSGTYQGAIPLESAEDSYADVLRKVGCRDLQCLLGVANENLLNVSSSAPVFEPLLRMSAKGLLSWGPVIDGVSLMDLPLRLIAHGSYNKEVPVMLGSCRDEMAMMMVMPMVQGMLPSDLDELREGVYLGDVLGLQPTQVPEVKALYDPSNYSYPKNLNGFSQNWWTLMRIITDQVPSLGHCGARFLAESLTAGGSPAVFVYLFAHAEDAAPPPGTWHNNSMVGHGADVEYTMALTDESMSASELRLAHEVAGYWASFAMTGSPNIQGRAHWPKYGPSDALMALQTAEEGGFQVVREYRRAACDYWAAHGQWLTPEPLLQPTAQAATLLV